VNTAINLDQANVTDALPVDIEAIKKAFIQMHELPAANEQLSRVAVDQAHVLRVKDWLQDLERQLGVKAKVVASAQDCGLSIDAPAAVMNDEAIIFADHIHHQKMALDVFEYAVVGLLGVERLLKDDQTSLRLFRDLPIATQEFLAKRYQLSLEDTEHKVLVVKMYLADLASLNIRLTWLERREAWQRQWVRLFYPKLKFESLDLHYLLLKARRAVKKG
tara:strand:- start:235 stop:891 length:657 start_codon:yes stop_codon:yes gene_type:complete